MKTKISYDKEYDDLIISNKKNNEKVRDNFIFDDAIISVIGKGKIVGIEIRDVSNFIEEMGFDSSILDNLESAELIQKRYFVGFKLKVI